VELKDPSTEDRKSAGGPRRRGALVSEVRFGTPAHDAGLRNGDIITGFNRVSIDNVDHLVRLVGASRVGLAVPMELYRKGEKLNVDVAPARRSDVIPGMNVHTWRGIRFANATAQVRQHLELEDDVRGVAVMSVADDPVAAKEAGFARGQMIQKVGETEITTVGELRPLLAKAGDGNVEFTLKGETAKTLTLSGETK
jgi:serine protease Do